MKRTPSSAFMMPFPVHLRTAPHRFVLLLLHMGHLAQKACQHRFPLTQSTAPSTDANPAGVFNREGTSRLALPRARSVHAVSQGLGVVRHPVCIPVYVRLHGERQCRASKQLQHLAGVEVNLVAGDDMVAWLDAGDTLSHTLHSACGFMAQYAGK